MGSFTYSTIIEAPIETVFDYVSDVDNRMEWQEALKKVERLTPKPDGVGTHWKETFIYGKKPQIADMRYAAFERPHIFTEDIATDKATGVIDVKFAEKGKQTELSVDVTMNWKGGLRLLAPLLNSMFKKAIAKDFGDINKKLKAQI